ncbi:MAG: hypothetical protein ACTSPO_15235 [Candidatus Heimdallarchaeaceae archaeon]
MENKLNLLSGILLICIVLFGYLVIKSLPANPYLFGSGDFNRIQSGVTNSSTTVATSSATSILSANSGRVYAELCNNDSTNAVWLHLVGATTSVAVNEGYHLQAGECYTIGPDNLYIGQIYGLASGGEVVVSTIEK